MYIIERFIHLKVTFSVYSHILIFLEECIVKVKKILCTKNSMSSGKIPIHMYHFNKAMQRLKK